MIRTRKIILPLFLSLLLAAAWTMAQPDISLAEVVGRFLKVEGHVDLLKKGQAPPVQPKVQDGVEPGDVILTKNPGRAQVRFVDDSVLTIAPESRVVIDTYMYDAAKGSRNAVLEVFQGLVNTVVTHAAKAQEKPSFIMKTSTATMGVRGTEWYALVKKNSTNIFLKSGKLWVRNINPKVAGEVLLNAMEKTQVNADQPPGSPQHFEMQEIAPLEKQLGLDGDSSSGGGGGVMGGPSNGGSGGGNTTLTDPFATGLLPSVTSLGALSSFLSSGSSSGTTESAPPSPPENGIKQWTGESGLWDDSGANGSNWTSPGAPTKGYSAYLTQNDSTDRTVEYNSASPAQLNELRVDATGTGDMTLKQDPGSALAADTENVGYNGRGTYIQTGGTNTANNLTVAKNPGSSGDYELQDGNLNATNLNVNQGGTFNQTGGALTAGSLNNAGTTSLNGGSATVTGDTTNQSTGQLNLANNPTFQGNTTNDGTMQVNNTTATFGGTFTNNGAYISDPATQSFNDLIITATGYLVGEAGDLFDVSNNLKNQSARPDLWNTLLASLGFVDGDDTLHDLYLPGKDLGNNLAGYSRNFAWGKLDLTGQILSLYDGNTEEGAALYVGVILGVVFDESKREITNIFGNGYDIYYDPTLEANAYLGGKTYELQDGGLLAPAVPLPSAVLLLGAGLFRLVAYKRRKMSRS
jgi:hypothetical protein